ncbi:hypothetical protein, partial [Streptomyces pseudoechinosporeus]
MLQFVISAQQQTPAAPPASITPVVVVALCSLLVALFSLIFTVASFWRLNAYQGKLKSWEPRSFVALINGSVLSFRFPLVLHNTGAKPIVVQEFRMRIIGESVPP